MMKNEIETNEPNNNLKTNWLKLKYLLQDKISYESSVKLLKTKTIEQFASKCCEIYQKKIEIHLLLEHNKQILSTYIKNKDKEISYSLPNVEVKNYSDLIGGENVKDFLFYFRENNEYMLNFIKCLNKTKRKEIIPFLCHFFYENFFMETSEQEEILYIIYLLLEEEINNLYSPSILSFLEDTFLGEFFTEFGNRYEITYYIDNILNSIIRDVEEKNSSFNSLEIISNSKIHFEYYKNDTSFFDMLNQENNYTSYSEENNQGDSIFALDYYSETPIKKINKSFKKLKSQQVSFRPKFNQINTNNTFNFDDVTIVNHIIYEKTPLKYFINKNFFENINECYLKRLLENEKNEIMKKFYIKQIKILKSNKNINFFNCNSYYEKMKEKKIISKLSIEQFNKSYEIITNFIDKLLNNLENKYIIPYSVKAICKFINILIQKRFKNISRLQSNALICCFLFDKLILPVLENPDINNSAKKMILSFNTRVILINVYEVLKKLIRAELFNSEQNSYLTIFNKYILNNYNKINNIIENILQVKIPEKLLLLSNQYYDTDVFSLKNIKREKNSINYNYFDENPNDFMQHKSICFNIKQFLLFYSIVDFNKDIFIKENCKFEKIFNNLQEFVSSMLCGVSNINTYYVIIKEEYNNEVQELLFSKDKSIKLNKPKDEKETLFKLKYCISHIFGNIKILHYWDWINEDYNTHKTFEFIHKYLTFYKDNNFPPLNWYTKFIINNLNNINKEYIKNDYEKLYNEIENDVNDLLKKLKELNQFLTVNLITKFNLIENKKKSFKNVLENVKRTELNIKALLFIELNEIKICLMKGCEYNKYIYENEKKVKDDSLIICKQKYCPHPKIQSNFNRINEKRFHCKNVKEFADYFSNFYYVISQEIINYSFGSDFYNSKESFLGFFNNDNTLNNENIIITESPKKILETYMKLISREMNENIIFNSQTRDDGFEIIEKEDEEQNKTQEEILKLKKEKENREKVISIIWNYILKSLCNKIYESESLFVDQGFNLRCMSLSSFVKPKNLNINEEIIDETILSKIKNHIKRIDELRTPGGMIEEFGIVVQLINLLYKFFLNQEQTEAGELLPVIIYCIITVKPKRIIFNINFSKFFFSEKELLGVIGYNMTQAESSIKFIKEIDGKQLGMTQEEFNKYCANVTFK